jgi:hypothetical protein
MDELGRGDSLRSPGSAPTRVREDNADYYAPAYERHDYIDLRANAQFAGS